MNVCHRHRTTRSYDQNRVLQCMCKQQVTVNTNEIQQTRQTIYILWTVISLLLKFQISTLINKNKTTKCACLCCWAYYKLTTTEQRTTGSSDDQNGVFHCMRSSRWLLIPMRLSKRDKTKILWTVTYLLLEFQAYTSTRTRLKNV